MLIVVFLAALPLNAAEIRIDPKRVDAFADAPQGLMKERPYLAHFSKNGFDLYFIAGSHEAGRDSPTCSLMRRAFKRFRIKKVVAEGRASASGDLSAGGEPTDKEQFQAY